MEDTAIRALQPLVMALSISTWFAGAYHEGKVSWTDSYIYGLVIMNFSQMWALYCLVLFYQGTKADLKPINPLPKFLCLKFIIFFTWFQGIVINIVTHYKWVKMSSDPQQEEKYESQLQNFIICVEMLILSICHSYAFPSQEFVHAHNPRSNTAMLADQWECNAPKDHFSSSDFVSDGLYNKHAYSPRSRGIAAIPSRMAGAVGRAVNERVERLQRLGSGVIATTGEIFEGVNVFDIMRVLQQTKELDALAAQDKNAVSHVQHAQHAQQSGLEGSMEEGGLGASNAGLGTPPVLVQSRVVQTSPLAEDLLEGQENSGENKEVELAKKQPTTAQKKRCGRFDGRRGEKTETRETEERTQELLHALHTNF